MDTTLLENRYNTLAEGNCCLSCGGAVNYAAVSEGEICVDLGSGRGTDVIRMAGQTGLGPLVLGDSLVRSRGGGQRGAWQCDKCQEQDDRKNQAAHGMAPSYALCRSYKPYSSGGRQNNKSNKPAKDEGHHADERDDAYD